MAQNNTTLYFLSYNNYYNRQVKKEDTLSAYLDFLTYGPISCNFDTADGVNTEHIMPMSIFTSAPNADYVIAVDESGNIYSRWFITDAIRLNGRQYKVNMQRDLVVDFFEEIVNAPCYIERAMCRTGSDLIFTPDNVAVNQIKQQEILLKDKTGCPWIVGYVAASLDKDVLVTASSDDIASPIISDRSYEEWQTYASRGVAKINTASISVLGKINVGTSVHQFVVGSSQSYQKVGSDYQYPNVSIYFANNKVGSNEGPKALSSLQAAVEASSNLPSNIFNFCAAKTSQLLLTEAELDAALGENGVLVKDTGDHYFKVRVTARGHTYTDYQIQSGELYNNLMNILDDEGIIVQNLQGLNGMSIGVTLSLYSFRITPYDGYVSSAKFHGSTVNTLQDAPYKMFCIPYPVNGGGETKLPQSLTLSPDPNVGMNIAMRLVQDLTKSNVYDLQLLPYCPALNFVGEDGADLSNVLTLGQGGSYTLNSASSDSKRYITPIVNTATGDGSLLSYIIWCDLSSFSISIPTSINVPTNNVDFKTEHEVSFWRLSSPNYNGSFQFKATSNRGIDYFECDCTYKPYSPYIHVAPNFKGLYGADYNDTRGLVCGGNFSLPSLTDAWANYEVQNKSYRDAFSRQIENMERTYNIQLEQQKTASAISVVTSGFASGASGGYIGGMAGGPAGAVVGTVAGAAAGATASAIGRREDLEYSKRMHREAISYAQDQFGLSLQSIQALPYSLNNVSAYDINNKLFPFLEYFTCSEEERKAYKNKIIYRSMPVNVISSIADFLQAEPSYIVAQLIRIPDLADDYHVAAAIASELHQGVYI